MRTDVQGPVAPLTGAACVVGACLALIKSAVVTLL